MAYNYFVKFDWDAAKEQANRTRHGISFQLAEELLTSGVDYLKVLDEEHSQDEGRFVAIGPRRRSVVVVVFTECDEETTRIISARLATTSETLLFRRFMEGRT